jgi:hypothetical protein
MTQKIFIFFVFYSLSLFSYTDVEIASAYNLKIGKYLLPASQKMRINNWYHPDEEDYRRLQYYLSCSPRPELKFTNYPNCVWRENRIRQFRLITKDTSPIYETIYCNNKTEKKRCIVTYTSINEKHYLAQNKLIEKLININFDGHIIRRVGGWPGTELGSLEFFDVPYAFKIFAIEEARSLGYQSVLWLDVCMVPDDRLENVFDHLEKFGVFAYCSPGYSMRDHISEFATHSMGISLQDFLKFTMVSTIVVGIHFENENGRKLMHDWHRMLEAHRLAFLSYIPEQAVFTFLANQQGLLPYFATYPSPEFGLIFDHPQVE